MKNPIIEKRLVEFIKNNTVNDNLYWYPLNGIKSDIKAVAYQIDDLYRDDQIHLLQKIVEKCGINHVNSFQLDSMEYISNSDIIELLYEKDEYGYDFPWYSETFYFDSTESWMIYVSHEGTIAFTGKEIADIAANIIPDKYICTGG